MQADDPQKKWRRAGQIALVKSSDDAVLPKVRYEPLKTSAAPSMLHLKCGSQMPDRAFPYGYITDVLTDTWSLITITFSLPFPSPVRVEIRGEFLEPIADAIISHTAMAVQAFDESRHLEIPDGQMIVHEIEIIDNRSESVNEPSNK